MITGAMRHESLSRLHRFREIWVVDTEFNGLPNVPNVVCVVARELRTNRLVRLFEDELKHPWPPFDVGPHSLMVAYFASAEWGCHLSLGWPLPSNVLGLYV